MRYVEQGEPGGLHTARQVVLGMVLLVMVGVGGGALVGWATAWVVGLALGMVDVR